MEIVNNQDIQTNKQKIIKTLFIMGSVVVFLACVAGIIYLVKVKPKVIKTYPVSNTELDRYDKPVEIIFNSPVDFSKLKYNTYPEIAGEWKFEKYLGFLPYGHKIKFTPFVSVPVGKKVMLYLANISKPFAREFGSEYLLEFNAPGIPQVISSFPENNAVNIPLRVAVVFNLSVRDNESYIWDFEINPREEYELKRDFNKTIRLTFKNTLNQGISYNIKVFLTPVDYDIQSKKILEKGERKLISETNFSTAKSPFISGFSPVGDNIKTDTPVIIVFDNPINQTSFKDNLIITPEVDGLDKWSDNGKTFTFTPNAFTKNTEYEVKLLSNLESVFGAKIGMDVLYKFKTIGQAKVLSIEPLDFSDNIAVDTPLIVTFDQEVNQESAQLKFTLNPPTEGSFSWEGTTMTFNPLNQLNFSTKYTINIDSGIESIDGLASENPVSSSFTTEVENFALVMPYFKQEESFTCNIAAARILLAFRGVEKTEAELKEEIGQNGEKDSGNPHKGYAVDYGVYWEPISKVVAKYRKNRVFTDWNLTALLTEVENGNPAMVWAQNGWSDPHEISWTALDGTFIYAINGMHSYVVRGYKGSKNNPTQILVNDPWRGEYEMETSEFQRLWGYFKTAMVID